MGTNAKGVLHTCQAITTMISKGDQSSTSDQSRVPSQIELWRFILHPKRFCMGATY